MADVTARSLQYEYKAVSMLCKKLLNTDTMSEYPGNLLYTFTFTVAGYSSIFLNHVTPHLASRYAN